MKSYLSLLFLGSCIIVFAPVVQAQGLTGHWEFEEGTGDIVGDSSGNNNNGTIFNGDVGGFGTGVNTVWFNDAERGKVASFGGTANGAYILIDNDIPIMTLEQDFTWAFWAKQAPGNGTNHIIFGNRHNVDRADFVPRQFIKFTPTKFEWHMNGNGNDNLEYDDLPNDVWIHHAVVKDGDLLVYYRDGVEANSRVITQALAEPQPLFIGGENTATAGENWTGYIDDVRIYNVALSASGVAAVASGGTSFVPDWSLFK